MVIHFSLQLTDTQLWRLLTFTQGEIVTLYNNKHEVQDATFIDIPINTSNYYTIRYTGSGDYDQVPETYTTSLNLSPLPLVSTCNLYHITAPITLPLTDSKIIHHIYKRIKDDTKVTLYLHDKMKKAKQGYLLIDIEGE